jgi:predicted dehydrogenase
MGFDCTVVEPSEEKRAIAKNRNYISFKSLNDIQLKSEHSVAFVCTPPAYHIEQTIWALEREMRVFLEKPIGIGLKECRKLLSYDYSKIFVGYTYRWNLQFIALRQTIETGQIGTPYFANFSMGMHLEDWHPQENYREFFMSKKSLGGGALLDESHFIDLALALFGVPNKILGTVSKISELEIDSDDYVNIEMQYNSLIANITMNLFKRPHESKIEVYGTKGSIICDFTNKVNILTQTLEYAKSNTTIKKFNYSRNETFNSMLSEFIGFTISDELTPRVNFLQSLKVMEVVEKVRESNRLEKWITFSESK